MMKKTYNKPALNIVLLNSDTHLLAASSGYTVNSYQSGGTTTVGDDEDSHQVKKASNYVDWDQ